MKWILNQNQSNRNRLNLLSLSLDVEMHNFLLLLSLIQENYELDINDIDDAVETTRQSERSENRVTKAGISRTNDNFFRRTKLLFNISRVANEHKKALNKINQRKHTGIFFHKSLCGRENMHTESDLQMRKLQNTKQVKTVLGCKLGASTRSLL